MRALCVPYGCHRSRCSWPRRCSSTECSFSAAIRDGRSGLLTLGEVAPPGFEDSEVFRRHYQDFGEADEVQHVITQCRGFTLIAGTGSAEPFRDAEISRHEAAHPLIAAGLARLAKLLESELADGDAESQGGVDSALEQFGVGALSEREHEVIHLILLGHNSESVAHQLGISWNTARRHRTRAYAKLGVSSQGELFYAFLRTLGLEPTTLSRYAACLTGTENAMIRTNKGIAVAVSMLNASMFYVLASASIYATFLLRDEYRATEYDYAFDGHAYCAHPCDPYNPLQLDNATAFPEFILEEAESLFEMKLTCNLINYQQLLVLARTLIALLAWVLACHEDPYTLFTVPPLEKGPT